MCECGELKRAMKNEEQIIMGTYKAVKRLRFLSKAKKIN